MNGLCYWEIPSTNVAKSSAFYAKLFGWKMEPSSEGYVMFQVQGGLGGRVVKPKTEIGNDWGYWAAFKDPGGCTSVALWSKR